MNRYAVSAIEAALKILFLLGFVALSHLPFRLHGEELGKVRCGKDFLAAEFQTKIVLITRSGYIAIDDKKRNE